MTKFALALAVVLLGLSSIEATRYKKCKVGTVVPAFVPKKVSLDPAKPHPGDVAKFTISGETAVGATSGKLTITAGSFVVGTKIFIPLQKDVKDLCQYTTCPFKPGPLSVTYDRKFPIFTPPGKYRVQVTAANEKGEPIFCIEVTVNVVRKLAVTF